MPENADTRFTDVPERLRNDLIAHREQPSTIEGMTYSDRYQSSTFKDIYLALRDGTTIDETQPIVFKRTGTAPRGDEPNSEAAGTSKSTR